MMKKIAILLLVLLMLSGLSSVTVTAIDGTAAEEPIPAGAKGANLSVSNPQLPADMKNWPPISELPASESMPDRAYGAINPSYRISDSPCLRLPGDMADWQPIVPPEPREVEGMRDPTAVEIYDVATGVITRIPSTDKTQQPLKSGLNTTPSYLGLLPSGVYSESVIPPDDRARISPTTSYPWRTICKLFLTFPDGATGTCSGAIIGCPDGHGYHVLTAGHCVYSHSHGGWATSVMVVPGLDEDYMPYNYAWDILLRSYTGWTVSGDHRHDWALVTLDRNVGDFTGWMGRMTADPSDSIYTGILNTAGYPCNVYSSSCPYPKTPVGSMWFDSDYGDYANETNHWYYMDTQGGQSGSPVWRYVSSPEARHILTIHAYGIYSTYLTNHGTRLNQDKFDRIYTWCNADTSPTDYADLIDDGDSYSGFTPTAVNQGDYFSVWCDVRNVGTAASGGFYVSYYASTNTYISTSDHLIGTDYVSSILPFTYGDSGWSGAFPSIPDGTYYVGWIIDSGGDVPEFDEGNNKAYKTYKLVVGLQDIAVSHNDGWWEFKYGPVDDIPNCQPADHWLAYGTGAGTPIVGDFNDDSIDDIGIRYNNGWWEFKYGPVDDIPNCQPADHWLAYGTGAGTPIVGDFNDDNIDDIGIRYNNGWWEFKYGPVDEILNCQPADHWLAYGIGTGTPIVGDFDDDGIDGIGIRYNNGWWEFKYGPVDEILNCQPADHWLAYGTGTGTPLVGDFENNGIDGIGIHYDNGWWEFKSGPVDDIPNCQPADHWLAYGTGTGTPLVGSFNP